MTLTLESLAKGQEKGIENLSLPLNRDFLQTSYDVKLPLPETLHLSDWLQFTHKTICDSSQLPEKPSHFLKRMYLDACAALNAGKYSVNTHNLCLFTSQNVRSPPTALSTLNDAKNSWYSFDYGILSIEEETQQITDIHRARRQFLTELSYNPQEVQTFLELYVAAPKTTQTRWAGRANDTTSLEIITQQLSYLSALEDTPQFLVATAAQNIWDKLYITPSCIIENYTKLSRGHEVAHALINLRNNFIQHNGRLVFKMATKYFSTALERTDLLQTGFFGVIRALDIFDPSSDNNNSARFGAYARSWIKNAIAEEVMTNKYQVHVPVSTVNDLRRMVKLDNKHFGSTPPTVEEYAAVTRCSELGVKKLLTFRQNPYSFDYVPEGSASLHELLPSTVLGPDEYSTDFSVSHVINQIFDSVPLPNRHKDILIRRFGLNGNPEETLKEIGNDIGLSFERVRQIQKAAENTLQKYVVQSELDTTPAALLQQLNGSESVLVSPELTASGIDLSLNQQYSLEYIQDQIAEVFGDGVMIQFKDLVGENTQMSGREIRHILCSELGLSESRSHYTY